MGLLDSQGLYGFYFRGRKEDDKCRHLVTVFSGIQTVGSAPPLLKLNLSRVVAKERDDSNLSWTLRLKSSHALVSNHFQPLENLP